MIPRIASAALALLASAGAAFAQPLVVAPVAAPPQWTAYADRAGTRVDYPSGIFSVNAGVPPRGTGVALRSSDARARLAIYAEPNSERRTPASYIKAHFTGSRAALDYRRIAKNFFVVSGVHEGEIYYSRCNFAAGTLHCLYMTYPKSEEKAWDAIVTRMSLSLRPLR